jgi:hypothetical protein
MSKLKFTNFKDFKRWGLKSDLNSDFLHEYFNFFRESLIQLEDDDLIKSYIVKYTYRGVHKHIIHKNDDFHAKIEDIFSNIEEKLSLFGEIQIDSISIESKIFLPSSQFNDITDILTEVLSCVNFLKDNGKELGFESYITTSTPEGLKIKTIKKL